jgi:hypothetical protein
MLLPLVHVFLPSIISSRPEILLIAHFLVVLYTFSGQNIRVQDDFSSTGTFRRFCAAGGGIRARKSRQRSRRFRIASESCFPAQVERQRRQYNQAERDCWKHCE